MLAWLAFIGMCDLFNTPSTEGVGGDEGGGGGVGGIVFFHVGERVFFPCVCENAKRAAAYNGGVMGEAVRRRLGKRHIRLGVKEESPELFCFPSPPQSGVSA